MFRIEKTHPKKTFKVVLSCQSAPPCAHAPFLKKKLLRTPEKLQRARRCPYQAFLF